MKMEVRRFAVIIICICTLPKAMAKDADGASLQEIGSGLLTLLKTYGWGSGAAGRAGNALVAVSNNIGKFAATYEVKFWEIITPRPRGLWV